MASRLVAVRPRTARPRTRRIFVSAKALVSPNAKQATADAVYAPIPGSASSPATVRGKDGCIRAMRCRSRARRLYPRPDHSRRTSPSDARDNALKVGKRARNRRYATRTRDTCVCWTITSLTRTRYGSRVWRHGRSRPERRYQARTRPRSVAGRASVSYNSGTEAYARLRAEGLRPSALFITTARTGAKAVRRERRLR